MVVPFAHVYATNVQNIVYSFKQILPISQEFFSIIIFGYDNHYHLKIHLPNDFYYEYFKNSSRMLLIIFYGNDNHYHEITRRQEGRESKGSMLSKVDAFDCQP